MAADIGDTGDRPEAAMAEGADSPDRIDRRTVEALYEEHGEGVRRFLLGVLRDPELTSDALQQTFVKAMEKGHTAVKATRKGWLYRVAYHEAMALRRRQATGRKVLGKVAQDTRAGWDEAAGPLGQLGRDETLERAHEAIDRLPEAQRRVLFMRIHEAKTFATIARELKIPLSTALTRMRLALEKLRQEVERP